VRRALAVLATALATALLPACGVPTDDQPRALDRGGAPFRVFEAESSPAPEGEVQADIFLLRDSLVVAVQRQVPMPGTPKQVLEQLFAGPTGAERDVGLSTALPNAIRLVDVAVQDRIALVTLDGLDEQIRTDQVVAFAQIVATLDGRPSVDGVRFRTGDGDLQVPRGDGSLTDAPVNRGSYGPQLTGAVPEAVPPPPEPAPEPEAEPAG
jgi:hypothetical protein